MIKIICVGKIKESFYKEALKEYEKRLSKYIKLQIIEVLDENINTLEKEKQHILNHIKDKDYIICLAIEGTEVSSIQFSEKIEKTFINYPNITFIIGGSLGIHEEIKKKSNELISFSKMTFPHPLFRILLLEQIYRSFKIIKNESYHK